MTSRIDAVALVEIEMEEEARSRTLAAAHRLVADRKLRMAFAVEGPKA